MTFMYMGDHGPPTQAEKEERYAQDQCRLDEQCQGEFHMKGCPRREPEPEAGSASTDARQR